MTTAHCRKCRWWNAVLVLAILACLDLARGATNDSGPRILSARGKVEVTRANPTEWKPAQEQQPLSTGDRVRTGDNSSALVRLTDLSIWQMSELSSIEIQAPKQPQSKMSLFIDRGLGYFFGRDKRETIDVKTRIATGAIRGTEFNISVDPNTGETVLTMLEGEVEFTGEVGPSITLTNRQQGTAPPNQPATRTAVLDTVNIIQWSLYYPGVLDLNELSFNAEEQQALATSISAYRSGDLLAALANYPANRIPASASEKIYFAALHLGVGKVPQAEAAISTAGEVIQARALRQLIAAVKFQTNSLAVNTNSATALIAASYYEQSRASIDPSRLKAALEHARQATALSPQFGFGWARQAEMEFSFGHNAAARRAVERAMELSPRNAQARALHGFLLAGENKLRDAVTSFEQAIALDPRLANAWLGRGLCRIRSDNSRGGLDDLEVAAALEPNRAVLRSYLGKAFSNDGDNTRGAKELELAKDLDSNDPTAWLYAALLKQQQNRINEAITDLERSQELNDNRSLYRSQLLLDQDRAVRSANLANIYLDAGMTDVSVREAAKGVSYDYANYSAHLFLADSYDVLRDPARFNLRYETVWFNELLLANILAPVGGGRLAQGVSAQEYSRLFEANHLGLASSTTVRTDGIYHERASQFGTYGDTGYALDLDYQHHNGVRPNNELDSIEWYSTIKHQFTPQDSALVLVKYEDYHSGDNFQYYNPHAFTTNGGYASRVRPDFSFDENQDPILVGAWHHEWSPGMHTIFLGARLINDQHFTDRKVPEIILIKNPNGNGLDSTGLDVDYRSQFEIYSAELNQICDWHWVTLSAGGRYQSGSFETDNLLNHPTKLPFLLKTPAAVGSFDEDFERITGYGYLTVKPIEQLQLTGGIAYDQETIPGNFRHPPLTPGTDERSQIGPKAAFVWSPLREATLRGVYTRSLGGVSLDESYRLEPTQLAGFPQAFRTLITESVAGSVAAPEFETLGVALDLKFPTGTYIGLQAERATADVRQEIGVLVNNSTLNSAVPGAVPERLEYEERTLAISVNQLLSDEFVLGARYGLTHAELDDRYGAVGSYGLAVRYPEQRATLHHVTSYLLFNHASGLFARAELQWYSQQNGGYGGTHPGDDFFQENLYAGYRFFRGRAEVRLGLLNLSGQDYRLNPLTVYEELPRKRVFEAQVHFVF